MNDAGLFGRSRWLDAALEHPVADFISLRDELQTGDLWFSTGRTFNLFHYLIRLGTRSRWAHVGMVLREGENLYLIDAPATASLRMILLEKALAHERVDGIAGTAAIVIARPVSFAEPAFPGALDPASTARWRDSILQRVRRGFPSDYDWLEIARIVCVLVLGGRARRWRGSLLKNHLERLQESRNEQQCAQSMAALAARWTGRRLFRSAMAIARRAKNQDPYTCAELVAELLDACDGFAGLFKLSPNEDDFLSPAVIAERIPLVALGRLL